MNESVDTSNARNRSSIQSWACRAMSVLALSLGVGATTFAFTVFESSMPPGALMVSCETMSELSLAPSLAMSIEMPSGPELRSTVSEVYVGGLDAADDAADGWADIEETLAERIFPTIIGAVALVVLVACSGGVRTLTERNSLIVRTGGAGVAVLGTIGAMAMAKLMLRVLASPTVADVFDISAPTRLDSRAVAFTICVSALVYARAHQSLAGSTRAAAITSSSARP